MQITTATSPVSTAWNAAIDAARTASSGLADQAITALMHIENAIDAAPVESMADAVLRLRLALVMAQRQDLDDDPAWCAVAAALDFLQRAETPTS